MGLVAALCLTALLAVRDRHSAPQGWGLLALFAVAALLGGGVSSALKGEPGGFSSVGALAGAGLVALALRYGMSKVELAARLDIVAPAAFLALAFARVGCLLEGCDVGSVGGGALAVSYDMPHPVWHLHVARGWIEHGSSGSAGTHPFALYIAIPTAAVALASVAVRGGRGTRALLVAVGYAASRSAAEWFRDPATSLEMLGLPVGFIAAVAVGLAAAVWWVDSNRKRDGAGQGVEESSADRG